jgi:hypothetical protein
MTDEPLDRLLELVHTRSVTRYHADIGPIPQDLGNHQWGVVTILLQCVLPEVLTVSLIREGQFHDVGEKFVGDMSYLFKRANPEVAGTLWEAEDRERNRLKANSQPTELERRLVKWADFLEAGIWGDFLWAEYGFSRYKRVADEVRSVMRGTLPPIGLNALGQQLHQEYSK